MAFHSKVSDVPGLQGIVVALAGFQSGARQFAEHNGLIALDAGELPSLGMLIGKRLEATALPDEATIGEPFWSLYEIRGEDNRNALGDQQR